MGRARKQEEQTGETHCHRRSDSQGVSGHPFVDLNKVGRHLGPWPSAARTVGLSIVPCAGQQPARRAFSSTRLWMGASRSVQDGEQPGPDQLLIQGVVGLGVGALGRRSSSSREQGLRPRPQHSLALPVHSLHCPGDVPHILHQMVVTEGDLTSAWRPYSCGPSVSRVDMEPVQGHASDLPGGGVPRASQQGRLSPPGTAGSGPGHSLHLRLSHSSELHHRPSELRSGHQGKVSALQRSTTQTRGSRQTPRQRTP